MDPEAEALEAARLALEDDAHRARREQEARTSWDAAEIPAIEDLDPERPAYLHRSDGRALLYRGKTHSFVGEPEGGKTWMALAAAAELIRGGESVMYVDFEDSAKGVVRRLVSLGVGLAELRGRLAYVRPEVPIGAEGAKTSLVRTGLRYAPALIVLDGVTECMALHGWDINSATDTARFLDWFPRLWERTGAAVVMIDHVVKSKDEQGRWAIGSQHKLAGVNGASYTFRVDEQFGRGRHGQATIGVAKDREGAVREFAEDGGKVAGVFHLVGDEAGNVHWEITPFDAGAQLATFAQKILGALADGPLNKGELHSKVGGNRNILWTALGEMESAGTVRVTAQGNSKVVELVLN